MSSSNALLRYAALVRAPVTSLSSSSSSSLPSTRTVGTRFLSLLRPQVAPHKVVRRGMSSTTPSPSSSSPSNPHGPSPALLAAGGLSVAVAAYMVMTDNSRKPLSRPSPPPPTSATPAPVVQQQESPKEAVPQLPVVVESKPVDEVAAPEQVSAPVVDPMAPLHAKYVIVGAGTAAHFAVNGILAQDPKAQILLIGEEEHPPYQRPPLSKDLWFNPVERSPEGIQFVNWAGEKRDLYLREGGFYQTPLGEVPAEAVSILTGSKVVGMSVEGKKLTLANGREVTYEKCLLALGGTPRHLPVFDNAGETAQNNIAYFRNISDYERLYDVSKKAKNIVVVGGGFLGSELAVGLAHHMASNNPSCKVTQVFPEKGHLGAVLPLYLSQWTTKQVEKKGVDVIADAQVTAATTNEKGGLVLSLSNGRKLDADYVVVAVGLVPNTTLAKDAKLEVDEKKGGIVVNSELQARHDVWVSGDVANFYDITLGRRREEHYDHAAVTGRLAGQNMAGAGKAYTHQSLFWSDLGPNLGFEAIGLVDSRLATVSVWAKPTPKDTPQAQVSNKENIRSGSGDGVGSAALPPSAPLPVVAPLDDELGKGVIFYMKGKKVVGVVTWNLFNKMPIARKIIREQKDFEVDELKRLFKLRE